MKNNDCSSRKIKSAINKKRVYEKPKLYARDTLVEFAIACPQCSGPSSCPAFN